MLSPLSLAFVGDAVWSLIVRQYFCVHSTYKNTALHRLTTRLVKATFQSQALAEVEGYFTEEEKGVARRARNVHLTTTAKNASLTDYRRATSFEAVIGYLYLRGEKSRLDFFLSILLLHFEEVLGKSK